MSDPSRPDELFIRFTPHLRESSARPASNHPRTAPDGSGAGRFRLPPEALGGWSEPPAAPRASRSITGRPAFEGVRPRPIQPPASIRPQPGRRGAEPSSGATLERRDTRTGYQDEWLNTVRRAGTELELIFTNGSALYGRLVNFDTYALIVEHAGETALVFKHAVLMVRPRPPEGAPAPVPGAEDPAEAVARESPPAGAPAAAPGAEDPAEAAAPEP